MGGASVAGVGCGGDGVASAGCGGGRELATDNSPVYLVADTLGDDGREKVRNAVTVAATRREARAATRQQEAESIALRCRGRRRDEPVVVATVAGCGGGIGRRERPEGRGGRETKL